MKNLKTLTILLITLLCLNSCCNDDTHVISEEVDLKIYFTPYDNLTDLNGVIYFNAICDRNVVTGPNLCILRESDTSIYITSDEYEFIDVVDVYPVTENITMNDNIIEIDFVTDISERVVRLQIKAVTK